MRSSRGFLAQLAAVFVTAAIAAGAPGALHSQVTRAIKTDSTKPPSSYTLIERALSAGRIDEETAYKYRVFAAFGDTRLPEQYRGATSGSPEVPASIERAGELLGTFSPGTQAELAPFFMPPGEPNSWINLPTVGQEAALPPGDARNPQDGPLHGPHAIGDGLPRLRTNDWYTVRAAGGKVKVWAQQRYAGDPAKADAVAQAVTTKIWPELVRLFWEPLSDAGFQYDGGGPEIDIYLVRPRVRDAQGQLGAPWIGLAEKSTPGKCKESARYLLVESSRPLGGETSKGMLQTVAHEFMHAIQARTPLRGSCNEYKWIREAIATWSEHFVYPRAQTEQDYAMDFLERPIRPLDHGTTGEDDLREYGTYLFPLYVMFNVSPVTVADMWQLFAHHNPLDGIDAALKVRGPGLDKTFPKFAVQNLNRASADDYKRKDRLHATPVLAEDSFAVSLGAAGSPVYEKAIYTGMPYLSTVYTYFSFDQSVKTVTFDNTLGSLEYAGVWGIPKIDGQWQKPEDWTAVSGKSWCRSNPGENIDALMIVFTNNQWKDKNLTVDPSPHHPTVRAFATGCTAWVGVDTMTTTMKSGDVTIEETITADMRFVVDSSFLVPGQPAEYWKVVSGTVTWSARAFGTCRGNANGSFAITDRGPGEELMRLRVWIEDGKLRYGGNGGPWPGDVPMYKVYCPDKPPVDIPLYSAGGSWHTDPDDLVNGDRVSLDGDYTAFDQGGVTFRYKYALRLE